MHFRSKTLSFFLLSTILLMISNCSVTSLLQGDDYEKVDLKQLRIDAGLAYRQGEYDLATELYQAALNHNQDDAGLSYNLACTYALQGKTPQAVYFVEQAFRNGFRDLELFKSDPDFDPVRSELEFMKIEMEIIGRFESIGDLYYVAAPSYLPYRIRVPQDYSIEKAYPLVVALHGMGGNADGFVAYYDHLKNPQVIYAAPEGQYKLSGNIGPQGHARSWVLPGSDKTLWIAADTMVETYILKVIEDVSANHDISKVYLLGYSQGAVYAYTLAIRNHDKIAGVVGLSGYLMRLDQPYSILKLEDIKQAKGLRVFMAHGIHDTGIPLERAQAVKSIFLKHGLDLTYREFEGDHGINPLVLQEAFDWITAD